MVRVVLYDVWWYIPINGDGLWYMLMRADV